MPNSQFLIFRNAATNEYFYQLVSGSREVIMCGEGYTKQTCLRAIASVKINSVYESRFDRWENSNTYSFSLKSSNWVVIGKSVEYTSAGAREKAILAVKRDAPKALIIEMR